MWQIFLCYSFFANYARKFPTFVNVIKLNFGYNLNTSNTQMSCNIGKSTSNLSGIFGFSYITAYSHVFFTKEEGEGNKEKEIVRKREIVLYVWVCVCLCVCVWEREREDNISWGPMWCDVMIQIFLVNNLSFWDHPVNRKGINNNRFLKLPCFNLTLEIFVLFLILFGRPLLDIFTCAATRCNILWDHY